MRIAYLGPAGTFTEDALREALGGGAEFEPLRTPTIHEAILAVEGGEAERALVPFENSIEGSVRSTLDTLAFDAEGVTIVGEYDFAVRAMLIAREPLELDRIERGAIAPSAARSVRPLSARGAAERRPAERRAAPPRRCGSSASPRQPWAAIGAHSAAELYGCTILREGIEDEANNVTRFVWIAPAGTEPAGGGAWKTSLVFSELGEDHPGALVNALHEFSSRDVNLTRIESRPLRPGLGRYMFFCDLEGALTDEPGRGADRGAADQGRIGSNPGVLPDCVEFPGNMARVLVLNATYEPINVCTLRRAAVLLLKEKAELLERREGAIHSEHMTMERPDVIRLVSYVRIPREAHRRKITRRAVLARDSWTCQYCGSRKSGLTVDHVIPRSRGGKSVWENIVAACATCNRRKGNRLPREIHMHPQEVPEGAGADGLHSGGEPVDPRSLAAVPAGGCLVQDTSWLLRFQVPRFEGRQGGRRQPGRPSARSA